MQEQLKKRIAELEAEYRTGQEMLTDLETRRAELHQTLLRISGAIQVLKELLAPDHDVAANGAEPPPPGPLSSDAEFLTQRHQGHNPEIPSPSLLAG